MALINCPECNNEVSETAVMCPVCGYGVKEHFENIHLAEINKHQEELKLQRKIKLMKCIKTLVPIIIIVLAVIIGLIVNHKVLAERMTFKNEDAMLEYLTSCKNWKLDNDYRDDWLVFHNTGLGEELSEEYLNWGEKITMHPKRGTFEMLSTKYIVSKKGDIIEYNKEFGDKYYKPNYLSVSVEEPTKALQIEIVSSEVSEQNIFTAEYKITNTGNQTYKFIELETVLTLDDKSTITVAGDFEIVETDKDFSLMPGKTGTADAFLANAPDNIAECSVHIKSYRTEYKN